MVTCLPLCRLGSKQGDAGGGRAAAGEEEYKRRRTIKGRTIEVLGYDPNNMNEDTRRIADVNGQTC